MTKPVYRSERRRELTFVALLLGLLVLSLAVAEAALRARDHMNSEKGHQLWRGVQQSAGVTDPNISTYKLRPNTTFGDIAINRLGFRGPELETPKPAHRVRIALLGTSTVFGGELREAQTLPALIVETLSSQSRRCSFDYVSISGPGYNHRDLAVLLAETGDRIDFDHVIVVHSGPEGLSRDVQSKLTSFLKRFRLYYALPDAAKFWLWLDAEEAIARDVAGLRRIVERSGDSAFWYFAFYGLRGDPGTALAQTWRQAAQQVVADGNYSEALRALTARGAHYHSRAHYSPLGSELAASLIVQEILSKTGDPDSLCNA